MLKKILIAVSLLLSVWLFACPFVARAQSSDWARIVDDDVYLYSNADGATRCFVLEKSYYVEILGEEDNMYRVSVMQNDRDFPKITGYVYRNSVTPCAPPVAPYYPTEKVTVTRGSASVRLSPTQNAQTEIVALNSQQLSYYGSLLSYGTKWYYVYYGDVLGYVEADTVSAPNILPHPTPLPSKPVVTPPAEQPQQPAETAKTPTAEILLIVFVVVLAVGLTLALFLPGNIKKKNSVFETDI